MHTESFPSMYTLNQWQTLTTFPCMFIFLMEICVSLKINQSLNLMYVIHFKYIYVARDKIAYIVSSYN